MASEEHEPITRVRAEPPAGSRGPVYGVSRRSPAEADNISVLDAQRKQQIRRILRILQTGK